MLATEITNHTQQALNRLMEQYRDLPRMTGVITALVDQIQDLEDAVFSLDQGRQLMFAVGQQLDNIGIIIGLQRNGLSDMEYLIFLLGTIAENYSDTTIETILGIVQSLFGSSTVTLQELFPAAVGIGVGSPTVDPSLYPVIFNIVQNSLGAGIALGFVDIYDAGDQFCFEGGTGKGFDDFNTPGIGGKFASIVYNNPIG